MKELDTLKDNFKYLQTLIEEVKTMPYGLDKIRDLERLLSNSQQLAKTIKFLEPDR